MDDDADGTMISQPAMAAGRDRAANSLVDLGIDAGGGEGSEEDGSYLHGVC
jgi:hypothetical protein